MKWAYILILVVVSTAFMSSSFFSDTHPVDKKADLDQVISDQDLDDLMYNSVYPKLWTVVPYDMNIFGRCLSGFSQEKDHKRTNEVCIYGTIFYNNGCGDDQTFNYKIAWKEKEIYLQQDDSSDFVILDDFVKKERTAEI